MNFPSLPPASPPPDPLVHFDDASEETRMSVHLTERRYDLAKHVVTVLGRCGSIGTVVVLAVQHWSHT